MDENDKTGLKILAVQIFIPFVIAVICQGNFWFAIVNAVGVIVVLTYVIYIAFVADYND